MLEDGECRSDEERIAQVFEEVYAEVTRTVVFSKDRARSFAKEIETAERTKLESFNIDNFLEYFRTRLKELIDIEIEERKLNLDVEERSDKEFDLKKLRERLYVKTARRWREILTKRDHTIRTRTKRWTNLKHIKKAHDVSHADFGTSLEERIAQKLNQEISMHVDDARAEAKKYIDEIILSFPPGLIQEKMKKGEMEIFIENTLADHLTQFQK